MNIKEVVKEQTGYTDEEVAYMIWYNNKFGKGNCRGCESGDSLGEYKKMLEKGEEPKPLTLKELIRQIEANFKEAGGKITPQAIEKWKALS